MMIPILLGVALSAAVPSSPPIVEQAPPTLRFVFEELVDLGPDEDAGTGPSGRRNRIALLGGTVSGPRLSATILPGGSDWQRIRSDGCSEILADYFLKTDDGVLIHVRNAGLACTPAGPRGAYLHANPEFEAPTGRYDWLNRSTFTSTIAVEPSVAGQPRRVRIRFYEVL